MGKKNKKKESTEEALKGLMSSMQDFRKNVQLMYDNCEKNDLKWLSLAVKNLLNVIDAHIEDLNNFEEK